MSSVIINVGGSQFETCDATIAKCPDSLLYANTLGTSNGKSSSSSLKTVFYDRSPQLFGYIIQWLRTDTLALYDIATLQVSF